MVPARRVRKDFKVLPALRVLQVHKVSKAIQVTREHLDLMARSARRVCAGRTEVQGTKVLPDCLEILAAVAPWEPSDLLDRLDLKGRKERLDTLEPPEVQDHWDLLANKVECPLTS